MPTLPRRLWDSCVIIGYLAGEKDVAEACEQIIGQAERGELEIVVSTLAAVEAAYLKGYGDQDSEERIREFFSRNYIIPASIDIRVSSIARYLIRKYRTGPKKIKPPDATHLATAIQWRIPIVETKDPHLLRLDKHEGDPLITTRLPAYEGPIRLPGLS